MERSAKRFGQNVGPHICCRTVAHFNVLVANGFAYEVKLDVNMFHACRGDIVLHIFYGALVVDVEDNGILIAQVELFKQLFYP